MYKLKEHKVRISESCGFAKYFCYRVQVSRVSRRFVVRDPHMSHGGMRLACLAHLLHTRRRQLATLPTRRTMLQGDPFEHVGASHNFPNDWQKNDSVILGVNSTHAACANYGNRYFRLYQILKKEISKRSFRDK